MYICLRFEAVTDLAVKNHEFKGCPGCKKVCAQQSKTPFNYLDARFTVCDMAMGELRVVLDHS